MRLAFCGKGGSGKSTVCSLFARYLADKKQPVLVVDGDINQHVGLAIGFDEKEIDALPKMGIEQDVLRTFARGINSRIESPAKIMESTPAGRGSGLMFFHDKNIVTDKYQIQKDGIRFMAVGGHEDKDVGSTCYHRYTGSFGIFLNHIVDMDDEYVLGDMCAGADPFASSGLATRFDAIVLVCEPTLKSVGVYDQCRKYGDPYGIRIFVVGNKIESDADIEFIKARVGNDYIATFRRSEYVRNTEKGVFDPISKLEPENTAVLDKIYAITKTLSRDWDKYQEVGNRMHLIASEAWGNHYMSTDANGQIDPDFRYTDVIDARMKKAAA